MQCTFRKVPGLSDVGMVSFINGGRYLSFGSTTGGSCGQWLSPPQAYDAQLKVEPSSPESATWALVPTTFVNLKTDYYFTSPSKFLYLCNGKPSATAWWANSYDFIWVFEQGLNTSNPDTVSIRSTRNVDQYFCFDGTQASLKTASGNEGPCSFILGKDPTTSKDKWMGGFGLYTQDGKILQKAANVTINDCTKTDSYPIVNVTPANGPGSAWTVARISPAAAASVTASTTVAHAVSSQLHGISLEEVNFAGDGGLYAQLLRNRDFEALGRGNLGDGKAIKTAPDNSDMRPWSYRMVDENATVELSKASAPFAANPTVLAIETEEAAKLRLDNPGYWGIACTAASTFAGSFYAKSTCAATVVAYLRDPASGAAATAKATRTVSAGNWTRVDITLAGQSAVAAAHFAVEVSVPAACTVLLDSFSLFPGDAVKGHCTTWNAQYEMFQGTMVANASNYNTYSRAGPRVSVTNSHNSWDSASADAAAGEGAWLIAMERNSDAISHYALAPALRNNNGAQRRVAMIGYDSAQTYLLPAYHVHRMAADTPCAAVLATTATDGTNGLACSTAAGDVVFRAANWSPKPLITTFQLTGTGALPTAVTATTVKGTVPGAYSPLEVVPETAALPVARKVSVVLPMYSFTVLKFEGVLNAHPASSSHAQSASSHVHSSGTPTGLMELGMLSMGVICTVLVKAQDNSRAKGWGGEEHDFEHPWTQSLFMFWAETLCLVAFIVSSAVKKRRNAKQGKVSEEKPKTFLETYPPILALPACCDMFATSVSSIGLLYCNASVWQMLRGSSIVFVTILGRIFFGRKPPMFRVVALVIAICGLILVGLSNVLSELHKSSDGDGDKGSSGSGSSNDGDSGSSVTAWGTIVGIVLVLFSQLINACQVTIEETLLKRRNLDPLQVVGMEGFFGTIIICIIVLPVVYFIPGSSPSSMARGSYDNAIDAFKMLGNNGALLGFVLGYIVCDSMFNFFAQSVTKYLTAVHYTLIDACRSIFVWAWQLLAFYCINERFGEEWTKYSGLQVAGFVLLSIGTAIFNELFKLPGFSYEQTEQPAKPKDLETAVTGIESTITSTELEQHTKCDLELGEIAVKKEGD
eukprot:m51a1_g1703 hypothetical protein (1095) ;mRNA; r:501058-510497